MLLLPADQAGAIRVLVSGAGSAWSFWVQREKHSWVETHSVPSWGCLGRTSLEERQLQKRQLCCGNPGETHRLLTV